MRAGLSLRDGGIRGVSDRVGWRAVRVAMGSRIGVGGEFQGDFKQFLLCSLQCNSAPSVFP